MALFEVIKKEKDDDNIVWKYPKMNFNTGSQLVVHESQEALFFSNGKALDLFGPGKYTLETNNIPLLRKLINIPTGGKSPFRCEVYFIDKSEKTMRWGTKSRLEFLEPKYKFPISIGACGELRFTIEDSRKLLIKLVGVKKSFDYESIDDFFESQILVKVKNYIAQTITEKEICIFEIDQQLEQFSNDLQEKLADDFNEFGIKLNKFFVTTIAKPEDNKQYLEFKELYFKQTVALAEAELSQKIELIKEDTEAKKTVMASQAQATKRSQEGYTYQEEKAYEIGKKVAENDAVGQFTNVGVGLGMISGVGGPISNEVSKEVKGAFATMNVRTCPNCHKQIDDGAFCKYCGTKIEISLTCPKCNAPIASDAVFCSKCGERIR